MGIIPGGQPDTAPPDEFPEKLPDAVTRRLVFAVSDERDQWLSFALRWAADAYAAGRADGRRELERETNEAFAAAAAVRHVIADGPTLAELERARWTLRGEPRTRGNFADPHPDDYRGAGR